MTTFNVGDRVICRPFMHIREEKTGTILVLQLKDKIYQIGVVLDERVPGITHSLGGRNSDGKGYWYQVADLSLEQLPYDPNQQGDTDDDI